MTNMLVFGKDAFRVDIVGHWLGGHEPGNFGLFHLARERGVSSALNPRNIPVYSWEDDGPELAPLDTFPRVALASPYLPKLDEPRFHLCNEPFGYPPEAVAACLSGGDRPSLRGLGEVPSGIGRTWLAAEYGLPAGGPASLEVLDARGQRVAVLAQGRQRRGVHTRTWRPESMPPGTCWYRLRAPGIDLVRPATLRA